MNRRTKILAAGFAIAMVYVVAAGTVYPTWIKPLLTIDQRIAARKDDLAKLQAVAAEVEQARYEYRSYVERNGSFDVGRVESSVRDRLNGLIEKNSLQNMSVSPSRPVEDRKTGLTTTVVTVSAAGSLESAVKFLKEVAEIPEVVRVSNTALTPSGSGRKGQDKDLFNLRVPVEVLVLPQHRMVGRIDPEGLKKPEQVVRHAGRDYSPIWEGTPFTEFVPLAPLRLDVQANVTAEVGQPVGLSARPSGGDGNYAFAWLPADGLNDASSPHPTVDSSSARSQTYTVTLTDGAKSNPANATVMVTIREPPPPPPPPPPQQEPTQPVITQPVVPVVQRWPDGRSLHIVMTLMRTINGKRSNEIMVSNNRTHEDTYYKRGDDFDGGRLVYVHQSGALVHRTGQFFVYPLGGSMDDHMEAAIATDYPELKAAAERAVEAERARKADEEARAQAEADALARSKAEEEQARAAEAAKAGEQPTTPTVAPEQAPMPDPAAGAPSEAGGNPGAASQSAQNNTATPNDGPRAPSGDQPPAPAGSAESKRTSGERGADGSVNPASPEEQPTAKNTPPANEAARPTTPPPELKPNEADTAKAEPREPEKKKPIRQNRPSRIRNRGNPPNPGRL